MSSLTRPIGAACVVATIALLATTPVGSAATSLKRCSLTLSASQHLGATYVSNLKVREVSCSLGRDVARAFNKCRKEKGVSGRCTRKVLKYSCIDTRPAAERIPTQFNGHVKCSRGDRRVTFDYQQNT